MAGVFDEHFSVNRSDKYDVLEKIGEGAFGEVRLGIDTQSGCSVAMKYVRMGGGRGGVGGVPRAVFREMEALKQLRSPYIVPLNDVFPSEINLVLVFEYMISDLARVIDNSPAHLASSTVKYFAQGILKGVQHCHACNIIHRDIKPSNILLNEKGQVKIADFGLARILDLSEGAASMSHQVATRWYRPPELLFGARRYTAAVDMWAVGTVLAELLTFAPLFPGTNDIDQIFKVFQILGTPTPENWPDVHELPDYDKVTFPPMLPLDPSVVLAAVPATARDLILQLVCLNPASRLTASQASWHTYLDDALTSCPIHDIIEQDRRAKEKSKNRRKLKAKGKMEVEKLILSNLSIITSS